MTIEGEVVPWPPIVGRVKDFVVRLVRGVLLRAVRAPREDGARRLTIVLWTAWNMGGTIRAAFNLAEYMQARGWQVDIISGYRDRDEPFFGAFPAGVPVFDLDDRRKDGLVRRLLRARPSVLMPDADRASASFNLWTDIQLVRRLRGRAGILVGTRPGVNLMLARLEVPGLTTIGLEQMNLSKHGRILRRTIRAYYPKLDALVVLTEQDREAYRALLDDGLPLHRIPNTVRPLPGAKADLEAKTVYAAGRFRYQKGFDLLIPAWAETAKSAPRLDAAAARARPPARAAGGPDRAARARGLGDDRGPGRGHRLRHGRRVGVRALLALRGLPADPAGGDEQGHGRRLVRLPDRARPTSSTTTATACSSRPRTSRASRERSARSSRTRRCAGAWPRAAVETAQEYTIEAIGPLWEALFAELSERA